MPWKINKKTGYCISNLGTEVILSDKAIGSYIPALGPYSTSTNQSFLQKEIEDLINQVEQEDKQLLFGSTVEDSKEGHSITFLKMECFWQPDPSARSHWLFGLKSLDSILAEWDSSNNNTLKHNSGVSFTIPINYTASQSCYSAVQPSITWYKERNFLHRAWPISDFTTALHSLGNVAAKIICRQSNTPFFPRLLSESTH